jgi:hypothetical protein
MTWLRRSPAERAARAQLRTATRQFKAAETQQQADQAGAEMDHAEDLLGQAQGKPPMERPAVTGPGTTPAATAADEHAEAGKPASGYRLVHDPADPRCMIEIAHGAEHGGSAPDGRWTPEQETAYDRAYDLYTEIEDNWRTGTPARNEMEQRLYDEFQLTDDTTEPRWEPEPEYGWDPEPAPERESEAGQ